MKFTLGSTEYEFTNAPNWTDAQDAKDGSFSVEVPKPIPAPLPGTSRIGIFRNANGVQAKGIYDSLAVDFSTGTRRFVANFVSGYWFCEEKVFRVKFAGDVNDVLFNMVTASGPASVHFLGIPSVPFSQDVEVDAIGEYLASGLDKLCAQIGWEWRIRIDTWRLEIYDPDAPTTGTDVNFPQPCDTAKQVTAASYVQHFEPTGTVIVAGKNTNLAQIDDVIPFRTQTTTERLEAGDLKRHFPLLAVATSIISVDVTGGVPDFTISIDPITQNATDGTSTELAYTVTIAALNGFTGDVALSFSGLSGITAVFDDPTITGGSGTTTLRLTPTDGTWTDGEATEEGNFTVTGDCSDPVLSHNTTAEVVIVSANCCDSFNVAGNEDGRPDFVVDFTSDSECAFRYAVEVFAPFGSGISGDTGGSEVTPFTAHFMTENTAACINVYVWCGPDAPEDFHSWDLAVVFSGGACA